MFKNVTVIEFGDYIWNQHEKCIQISTNMPDTGLEMCDILRILGTKGFYIDGGTNGRVQSINELSLYVIISGESIPIRLFLSGYELTPSMRDVNKKFSVRYYLNLVLVDEEERRYFKQQVRKERRSKYKVSQEEEKKHLEKYC